MSEMPDTRPILLSGYAAKECARRVHNEWDPTIEQVPWEVPPALQMRFDAGAEFEAAVLDEIKGGMPAGAWVDLSDVRGKAATVEATLDAMEDEVEVILGGWLSDDVEGGRTGRPDLLVHAGGGRYVPGDIKGHKMTAKRAKGTLMYSLPGAPGETLTAAGYAVEKTSRVDDYLQLAHYWRMLVAIDRAADGTPRGFILGTDLLTGLSPTGHLLSWLDLDRKVFETYSRSHGKAKRSALERYDHELEFRLKIARNAAAGEPALVRPIFTDECDGCPWYEYCLDIAAPGDPSAAITSGRLSVREWLALADLGVTTVNALAELDLADEGFRERYDAEATHIRDAERRLAAAVRRARMIRDGVTLERETTGTIAVPRADIEIDFDIEWDTSDHVYLWGALVTRAGGESTYVPFVRWTEMNDGDVTELAAELAAWLRAEIAAADAAGKTLLVYHYSSPEPTYLSRVLGKENIADLLERFVDLLPVIKANFFGLNGLGIKKVAPAFGFEWRDEDPGGLQSQLWLLEARGGGDPAAQAPARERILAYNEDDVRATAAVRNAL